MLEMRCWYVQIYQARHCVVLRDRLHTQDPNTKESKFSLTLENHHALTRFQSLAFRKRS